MRSQAIRLHFVHRKSLHGVTGCAVAAFWAAKDDGITVGPQDLMAVFEYDTAFSPDGRHGGGGLRPEPDTRQTGSLNSFTD